MNFTFIINHIIDWLKQTETQLAILSFIFYIPTLIKKFNDSEGKNVFEKIVEIAKEESLKLVQENLSNDEKRKKVIDLIYSKLNDKEKQFVSEDTMIEAINLAYHTYIKGKQ